MKSNEFYRKAIHVLNIMIPLSHMHIIKNKIDMIIFLSAMLIFCFFVEIQRSKKSFLSKQFERYFFFMMRDFEKEGDLTGSTWVFVGALFTIIIVPYPFCLLALFFLAVGDTFASLVGMNYPCIKVGEKTLSGSIACFLTCLTIGSIYNFEINSLIIFIGALVATAAELFCKSINDNVMIPLFSGLSMYIVSLIL